MKTILFKSFLLVCVCALGTNAQTAFIDAALAGTPAEHEVLENPSGAQTDATNFPNDYLMEKNQYVLSYSRDRGTPNWVEWHLDLSWTGSATRPAVMR